jgi:phage tail sheath protein FI
LWALDKADLFNLLCLPPYDRDAAADTTTDMSQTDYDTALDYCKDRRAMLIMDPPGGWTDVASAVTGAASLTRDPQSAIYFPRVRLADPLRDNKLATFVPCGVMAGVMARIDSQRGVWKAPAGIETTLLGVREFSVKMTDGENGQLNPLGINCLRTFPVIGNVSWGARTSHGADILASQWKYIPVRRLANYIEESLYRGTQWAVFEPNDEPLWMQLRLNIGGFMQDLFRKGAFQGSSPREAYLVKCDSETTTQGDIDRGIVNIIVGFAPLKPAEFVIIKITQLAGQQQA